MSESTVAPGSEFDVESVLAAARERTGLDDFGDDAFREPMIRLLDALENEAGLNAMGRGIQRERVVGILVTRARIEEYYKRHPEIADEQIGAPIVICGLPRTGTTMLHRVMAEEPEFDSALWYEVRHPAPFEGWTPGEPDTRIPAAEEEVRMTTEGSPELMAIHPFSATAPDEEIMLLEQSFQSRVAESYCRIPKYSEWLDAQDQQPAYDYLLRSLKFLQWQHRQEDRAKPRWVLKAPHHLGHMPRLFKIFPDAKVVQTHRDPVESIPSICSLSYHLEKLGNDAPDQHSIGKQWTRGWASYLSRCLAFRSESQDHEDRFVDIWYLDSVRDPVGTVRTIYDWLGRELTPVAEEKMKHHAEENAREKRAAHAYSLEQFGLSKEALASEFADYRERYILPHQKAE